MATATVHPNHQLISSEDVEGTNVYDMKSNKIGEIDHLMIDKISGRVTYAVMSFGGFLGLFNLFTGGQFSRSTVFALGIMPYISSSIFVQIAGAVLPQVEKMQKEEEGRKRINQWTRYATVGLAAVQGWGFALFVESLPTVVI